MTDKTVEEMLVEIRANLKLMREHADEMYKLVPGEYKDSKDKRMAGWHGHEVNKYKFRIDFDLNRIEDKLK